MGISINYLTIITTLNGLFFLILKLSWPQNRKEAVVWVEETRASAVALAIFLGERKDNGVTFSYEL